MGILKRIIQIVRAETASIRQSARPLSRKSTETDADFHEADFRPPINPQFPHFIILTHHIPTYLLIV